jgi:hypothetical protein
METITVKIAVRDIVVLREKLDKIGRDPALSWNERRAITTLCDSITGAAQNGVSSLGEFDSGGERTC